jgi:NitT/TauT family transport system permease protein
MIRQPIRGSWRIGLGMASILALLVFYLVLRWANPEARTLPPLWSGEEGEKSLVGGFVDMFRPTARRPELDEQTRPIALGRNPVGWLLGWRFTGYFFEDAWGTFSRHFLGMTIAAVVSLALGLAMGCFSPIEAFLVPPLSFLAKVPPTAILGVFLVLIDDHERLYIAMILFGVIPTLAQTVYHSARSDVPDELIFKARTLGASTAEVVWNVIYKQILPRFLEAVRLQVGPALVYLIAAELLVGDAGFGFRLKILPRSFGFNVMYCYVVMLGAAGYLMDYTLSRARRRLCPWFGS